MWTISVHLRWAAVEGALTAEIGGACQHDFTYSACIFNQDFFFLISVPLSSCSCNLGKQKLSKNTLHVSLASYVDIRVNPFFVKGKKATIPSRFLFALQFLLPQRGRLAGRLPVCLARADWEYTVFIVMLVLNCFKFILSGKLLYIIDEALI